jgi:diguanylate cyclase (GGDEF)-like protein
MQTPTAGEGKRPRQFSHAIDWPAFVAEIDPLSDRDPSGCLARLAGLQARIAHEAPTEARLALGYFGAWAHLMLMHDADAVAGMQAVRLQAAAAGRADWASRALTGLGVAYASFGDFQRAVAAYEEALADRRAAEDMPAVARILVNLALTLDELSGMQERAERLLDEARALALAHGDAERAALALVNLASRLLARARGEPKADLVQPLVRRAFEAAVAAATEGDACGYWGVSFCARLEAARSATWLGMAGEAQRWLDAAAVLHTQEGNPFFDIDQLQARAELSLLLSQPEAALEALHKAHALASSHERRSEALHVLEVMARAHEALGQWREALACERQRLKDTLALRDHQAERRASVLQVEMDLQRERHAAELARVRAALLQAENQRLQTQAQQDGLTGVANRHAFDPALAAFVAAERPVSTPGALVLLDLDHFKRINDQHSHLVGDEVLRHVGQLLRDSLRGQDLAARWGGEEFVLLLDRVDSAQALEVCERLRLRLAAHDWAAVSPGLQVTASIGVAMAQPGEDGTALAARADAALYSAKQQGRNQTRLADAA